MEPQIDWDAWVRDNSAKLVLYARRWTRNQAEAEDWVQEALMRCWRRRDRAKSPACYLYRSVRNVAIDASRRNAVESRHQAVLPNQFAAEILFEDTVEQDEWRQQVEAALKELPIEQSEVVVLKIWSELTFHQIADVTEAPLGTVTSRYRYALNSLKSYLSEYALDENQ